MNLYFKTEKQKLIRVDENAVAENSQNFLYSIFDFDESWEGFAKKAVFECGAGSYARILTDDSCTVPCEVLSANGFYVSLIGVDAERNMRITSSREWVAVLCGPSLDYENAQEPTLSEIEQLASSINDLNERIDGLTGIGGAPDMEAVKSAVDDYMAELGGIPDADIDTHNSDTGSHTDIRGLISALDEEKLDASALTEAINTALDEAKASGEFEGEDGYTPIKGIDYYTDDDKSEFTDYIATELAKRGQLKPEFVNTIEECIDTAKLYVLPDNHIYAYLKGRYTEADTTHEFPSSANGVLKSTGYAANTSAGAYTSKDIINIIDSEGKRLFHKMKFRLHMGANFYILAFYNGSDFMDSISILGGGSGKIIEQTIDLTSGDYADATGFRFSSLSPTANSCYCKTVYIQEALGFSDTGHAFVPADYEDRIIALENEIEDIKDNGTTSGVSNPFNGKKAGWMGDSIVYGLTPSSGKGRVSFADMTATALGMTIINDGVSGSTIAQSSSSTTPMSERYSSLDADCDVIVVSGGTNDFSKDVALGAVNDTANTTFYGALRVLCEGLIARYPAKLIIFTTPIKRSDRSSNTNGNSLKEYCDAIKEVCGLYSIPVLDLWAECGLNPQLTAQSGYFSDGLHPTKDGHTLISRRAIGYFRQLYL